MTRLLQSLVGVLGAVCAAGLLAPSAGAQVAVRADTLHTMAGPAIKDGVVVITDGKIAAVGPASTTPIPPGHRVLRARVATPGLVDARCTVGLSGILNARHDSDQLERSAPIQPELRALDAYNPHERLVEFVRSFGVTTIHTGHAPGELISGQTFVVKTVGNTADEALVLNPACVAATLGPSAQRSGDKSPGTRAKQVAMLREELIRAREYADRRARPPRDRPHADPPADPGDPGDPDRGDAAPARSLRLEALADVLAGKTPLLVTANRAQDIAGALRLAEEFRFRLILDSAAEAGLLIDQIKAAGVPVILHPTMMRATGEAENLSFETASVLAKSGISFAIQSGFEGYVPKARIVLHEAAVAAANGLTIEQALAAITIGPARILGIDGSVGSLETGKDGDIALFDGDPFEYTSHCVGVVVRGLIGSDLVR